MGINEKTTNQPHRELTVICHQFPLLVGKEPPKALQMPHWDLAKNKESPHNDEHNCTYKSVVTHRTLHAYLT